MILDRSGCVGLIHTKEVVASGGVVGQVLLQALSDVVLGVAVLDHVTYFYLIYF